VLIFISTFLIIQALNSFAILAACGKNKSAYQTIIPIGIISFIMFNLSGFMHMRIFYFGGFGSAALFSSFATEFIALVDFTALMICGAIISLMPQTSNRAFPMRILLTAIFCVTVAVIVGIAFSTGMSYDNYGVFETIVLITLFIAIFTTIGEPDNWSIRIRRSLPKSIVKRIILFPFYSGSACGIIWILMIILATGVLEKTLLDSLDYQYFTIEFTRDGARVPLLTGCLFFVLNYAITAVLIRSSILKKLKPAYVKLIMLGLLFLFIVGSFGIYLLINLSTDSNTIDQAIIEDYSNSILSMWNPVCDIVNPTNDMMSNLQLREMRVAGLLLWSAALLFPLAIWFGQRIKDFSANFKEPLSYEDARDYVQKNENPKQ
jgi:hypothetical protein